MISFLLLDWQSGLCSLPQQFLDWTAGVSIPHQTEASHSPCSYGVRVVGQGSSNKEQRDRFCRCYLSQHVTGAGAGVGEFLELVPAIFSIVVRCT